MKTLTAACAATLVALAACAPKAEKTVAAIDPRAPPTGQMPGAGPRTLDQMLERSRARFAGADLNSDGEITLAEAETQTKHRFDRLDSDHDGVVTPREIHAALGPPN